MVEVLGFTDMQWTLWLKIVVKLRERLHGLGIKSGKHQPGRGHFLSLASNHPITSTICLLLFLFCYHLQSETCGFEWGTLWKQLTNCLDKNSRLATPASSPFPSLSFHAIWVAQRSMLKLARRSSSAAGNVHFSSNSQKVQSRIHPVEVSLDRLWKRFWN